MMKWKLLRLVSVLFCMTICLSPISSWAVTHLNTLETVEVGDNGNPFNDRALQGITAGPDSFYTSQGGASNPEYLYRFNADWDLQSTVGPVVGGVSHIGDLSTDSQYVYAPLSDFGSSSRDPLFAIATYDRSTMSYQGCYGVSTDFNPDSDIAGVARYHDSIYAVEWLDDDSSSNARILRYDFDDASKNSISLVATYEIGNRYANGIEFYGNYAYITHGNSADPGQIDVYRVDDFSTLGVNSPIHQYTYDLQTWHSEGLTFSGTDLWVANGDYVTRLQTPALPEYVTWVGSGSASAGSGTSWSGYYNWDGKPTSTINAQVNLTSSGSLIINSSAYAKNLSVDGPVVTVQLQDGCSLSTSNEYIGQSGTVLFFHSGGTNSVNNELRLGCDAGSLGAYSLSGTGQLSSVYQNVGYYGTGTFKQTGGTNTVGISLCIGHNSGSNSTYELSGDGQLSSVNQYVGLSGTGTFKQTGGTNTVSTLSIGYYLGSNSTYELSGTGQLSSSRQYVGAYGTGTFTQSGGTNTVSNLYLGRYSGSNGTYELSGTGQLSSAYQYVGYFGTGTFTQTGGTNSVGDLIIGYVATGTYELSGDGHLSSCDQFVGYSGTGTFTQTGGTNSVGGNLYIGQNFGPSGAYTISAGQLTAPSLYVGYQGSGTLNVTTPTPTITVSTLLHFGPNSIFLAAPDSIIHMTGSAFENESTDAEALAGLENLTMIFECGIEDLDPFEVAGEDLGALLDGFENNFALGTLQIGGDAGIGQLQLVDLFDNQTAWEGSEALYVENLILGAGSYLDLNGLNLYYQTFTDLGGTIDLNGGTLAAVPEPSMIALLLSASVAGFVVRWRRRGLALRRRK